MGSSPNDHNSERRGGRTTRRPLRNRLLVATALTAGVAGVGFGAQQASAIVDGTATSATENPWQVALVDGEGQFCGGTLISERVVVTAAHCVVGTPESGIQVRAGVADLGGPGGQTRQVTSVIEHARYGETGTADIAMLVLDNPFERTDTIALIPTATAGEVAAATTARVTGWGVTSENGDDSPAVLQSADVPVVDDAACDSQLGIDAADELCAGGTGTDSCYGDSGGPLTIDTPRGRVLAGVVSWGDECGGSAPGVYAEVPTFADWIDDRVSDPDAPVPDRPAPDADDEYDDEYDDEFDPEFDDEFDDEYDDDFDPEFDDDWTWDDGTWDDGTWDDETWDDGTCGDGAETDDWIWED